MIGTVHIVMGVSNHAEFIVGIVGGIWRTIDVNRHDGGIKTTERHGRGAL